MIEVKRLDDDSTALICPDLATADCLIVPNCTEVGKDMSTWEYDHMMDQAWKWAGYRYEPLQ